MKQNESSIDSITEPLLRELMDLNKANPWKPVPAPSVASRTPQRAELDQDAGGAYNPDHTFPQT